MNTDEAGEPRGAAGVGIYRQAAKGAMADAKKTGGRGRMAGMRRVGRILLNVATGVSLVLTVATVALWLYATFHAKTYARWRVTRDGPIVRARTLGVGWNGRALTFRSVEDLTVDGTQLDSGGALAGEVSAADHDTALREQRWLQSFGPPPWTVGREFRYWCEPRSRYVGASALRASADTAGRTGGIVFRNFYTSGVSLTVPFYQMFLLSSLVTAGLAQSPIRAWRRRCRRTPCLCPACGYDLRATPDRCPECGKMVGPAQRESIRTDDGKG